MIVKLNDNKTEKDYLVEKITSNHQDNLDEITQTLEQLQFKVKSYENEITYLKLKGAELEKQMNDHNQIERHETSEICTIEKCFDFSKCDTKLSAFIFNPNSQIENLLNHLQFEKLNRSIHLTFDHSFMKNSCITVIFLIEKFNIEYYKSVTEFILENGNSSNILVVDVNHQSNLRTKSDLKKFLNSILKTNSQLFDLSFVINKFMWASLSYVNSYLYDNLFFHFSPDLLMKVNSNMDHLPKMNDVDRFYLFSYFGREDLNTRKNMRISIEDVLQKIKTTDLKVFTDFECKTWPNKQNVVSNDDFENELCFDLNERSRILYDSTFALIFQGKSGLNWDNSMVNSYISLIGVINWLKFSCTMIFECCLFKH